jgi:hypothetical protein
MDALGERRAKNEALFREVNERIEEVSRRLVGTGEQDAAFPGFVCECSRRECTESVPTTYRQYEAVRENPRLFLVLPGHEDPKVDRVIERHEGCLVVEKRSGASEIALELDPRSE